MSVKRIYAVRDLPVGAYLQPFFSDHHVNAQRSIAALVNDKSDPHNTIANRPDQFVLFELGLFHVDTGQFENYENPVHLGILSEYVQQPSRPLEAVNA